MYLKAKSILVGWCKSVETLGYYTFWPYHSQVDVEKDLWKNHIIYDVHYFHLFLEIIYTFFITNKEEKRMYPSSEIVYKNFQHKLIGLLFHAVLLDALFTFWVLQWHYIICSENTV